MNKEHIAILAVMLALSALACILVLTVYFFSPGDSYTIHTSASTTTLAASTTTSTSASTTTSTSASTTTSTIIISTTLTTSTTSSTIQPELASFELNLPEGNLYRTDSLTILVSSYGEPLEGVSINLDNKAVQLTDGNGMASFQNLEGGLHSIKALKEGYETVQVNFSVYNTSYAYSAEIRVQHTPEERARYVSEGKVVLIFYDLPNCANCIVMRPWVADIVNKNRDCIRYELLNMIQEGPLAELRVLLEGQSSVATPVILIEGPNGRFMSTGYRTKASIEAKLQDAAGEECLIK